MAKISKKKIVLYFVAAANLNFPILLVNGEYILFYALDMNKTTWTKKSWKQALIWSLIYWNTQIIGKVMAVSMCGYFPV